MGPTLSQDFQVLIQCAKMLMVVSIAIICYEALMQVGLCLCCATNESMMYTWMIQGSDANWEKIMAAGKEDALDLIDFVVVKVKQLAATIMEKK